MRKNCHILLLTIWKVDVQDIRRYNVEVSSIPGLEGIKVCGNEAKMAQFVNSCGARIETLKLAAARFGGFVVYDELLWEGLGRRRRLSVDEGDGEVLGIEEGYDGAATWGVGERFYAIGLKTRFVSVNESVK